MDQARIAAVERLTNQLRQLTPAWRWAPVVEALQAFARGVDAGMPKLVAALRARDLQPALAASMENVGTMSPARR